MKMSENLLDGTYEIPYYVSNGGDGSANVYFPQDKATAEKADENQYEGWGESSAGTLKIVIKDGKVFFEGDKVTFTINESHDEDESDDVYYTDIDSELLEAKKVK
jgi:hypothetical protein